MDIGTLLILAGLFFGAVIGDAVLFGKTVRVDFSLPPAVVTQGMTEDAAEAIFISEFSQLADIPFILPFPTVAQGSKNSLLSVVAKPLRLDPIVEVLQGKLGSDLVTMKLAMMNGPGSTDLTLAAVVTYPNGNLVRYSTVGRRDRPDVVVATMARQIAADALPYRVALADYLAGVQGDPDGFERSRALASKALTTGFDRSRANQRVMLYNTLGLIAVHEGNLTEAERLWKDAMEVPLANGTAYAVVATNRSMLALARKDVTLARSMLDTAQQKKTQPYLPYLDHHLGIVEALASWAEGKLEAADASLVAAADRLVADTALSYRSRLATARGRPELAKELTTQANFLRSLKNTHPDLIGSVYWVDPVAGGLTRRQ